MTWWEYDCGLRSDSGILTHITFLLNQEKLEELNN